MPTPTQVAEALDSLHARTKAIESGSVSDTWANPEIPAGTIDGTNVTFTLSQTPSPALSLELHLNGKELIQGATFDYTLSGDTITMRLPPYVGDTLSAQTYRVA